MPHKEDDISYLLSQISEGNSSCFEKMYKRYFKKCYSIALYFVQSTSSAEDERYGRMYAASYPATA